MRVLMLIGVLFYAGTALAATPDSIGIAAVVDDQVISTVDLNDRVALIMGTTGIPDTEENRAKLAPQILRQLIDEKLELQDAAHASITISDAKLQEGIAQIERQSNKPPGSLEQFLQSKGLSKASFLAQVRGQMAWSEIVLKKIRPKIRISDQEAARYVKKAQGSSKVEEVQIATIQLPVDAPKNEPAVHKLADKLAGEIQSGASFEAIAAQFSSDTGGKKAEAFWVELPQLDPAIAAAIGKTIKGGVTDPVRTAVGYQIVKFIDTRQVQKQAATAEEPHMELAFKQILMTLKPDAKQQEAELLLQLAKEVKKSPGKCEEKTMAGAGDLAALDFTVTLLRSQASDVPERLRALLLKLKVGEVSEPIITPQGIRLFMLCERIETPASKAIMSAEDDAARESIYREKLELEAQKYLRNLRREAFVEIRARQ